jgi:hypothetical protein
MAASAEAAGALCACFLQLLPLLPHQMHQTFFGGPAAAPADPGGHSSSSSGATHSEAFLQARGRHVHGLLQLLRRLGLEDDATALERGAVEWVVQMDAGTVPASPEGRGRPVALPPLSACEGLMRTCSNPRCANLEGDSEAELRLQVCAGCGGPSYCGRACQVAHWRAGHKEACAGKRG